MRRVKLSALILGDDGLLRLRYDAVPGAGTGEPFTGLAYGVEDDGIVVSIAEIEAGAITGESTDWIDIPAGGVRVDGAILDPGEGYGPFLLHGAPFTGAAYDFEESGECTGEALYRDAYPTDTSQRTWFVSGAPRDLTEDDEYTSWFEDGRLQQRAIGANVLYNVVVRPNGCLGGVCVYNKSLFDLEAVRRLPFDAEVMLIGTGFDTSLLAALRDHAGLHQVRRLRLYKTGIGAEGIDVLVSLTGIRAVWLMDNPALGRQEANELRARRRDWEVHLDPEPAP
jgi:hypothetical protein